MHYKNSQLFLAALALMVALTSATIIASSAPKKGEAPEAEKVDVKKQYEITDNYVHTWLSFPSLTATSIFHSEELVVKPKVGYMTVVMFLASWCLPCQKIFPKIHTLHKTYGKLNAKFLYVFVNDTKEDAQGFAAEYKLQKDAVLANTKLKTDFHNPQLPTIYMSDREGWLLNRYIKMQEKDLGQFERLLQLATAY